MEQAGFPLWLDESTAIDQLNRGGNVGVAGELVGSCILDVDSTKEARDFIVKMQELESETLCWWTPRGLQAAVWDPELKQTQTKGAGGIDVRTALQGYGMLPGSWRNEESYKDKDGRWKEGAEELKFPALYMPLRGQAPIVKLTDEVRRWIERKNQVVRANAATGNGRHRDMLTLTGRMVHAGASEAQIETTKRSFVAAVGSERGVTNAEKEFQRAVDGAKLKGWGQGRPPADAPVQERVPELSDDEKDEMLCALYGWQEEEKELPAEWEGLPLPEGSQPEHDQLLSTDEDGQTWPVSEAGLAAWMHDHGHQESLKYLSDQKRWLEWVDGKGWTAVEDAPLLGKMRSLTNGVLHKLSEKKGLMPDPVRSGQRRFRHNVMHSFGGLTEVLAPSTIWNADPHTLGLPGGLKLDLITRTTGLRTRADLLYLQLAGAPAEIDGSLWKKFLEEAQPCAWTRLAMQVAFGSMLGPQPSEHFVLVQGPKRSGKSTLSQAILHALGADYGSSTSPALVTNEADSFSRLNARRMLQGKRMIILPELTAGVTLNEEALKTLGGGRDTITTRAIGGDMFSFEPSHGLVIVTNRLPFLARRDDAVADRAIVFPMDRTRAEHERDASLTAKLRTPEEIGAIITWLVEGYQAYLRHGLVPPSPVMTERKREWLRYADLLSAFFEDRCVMGEGKCKVRELLGSMRSWFNEAKEYWPDYLRSPQRLATVLEERGLGVDRTRAGVPMVHGVTLLGGEEGA